MGSVLMRISRPCYDKYHRCPGRNGGGMHYAKVQRCERGMLDYPQGFWWRFKFNRCAECKVIVFPWAIRYADWTWLRREPSRLMQRIKDR